jgi:hypothetical protein
MQSPAKKLWASVELVLPFALAFALYFASITGNLAAAHDSIAYINAIDARTGLFHPHHLLYNASAAAWVAVWRALGVSSDSAFLVSTLNAVFGSLTVSVFYLLLRGRLRFSISLALLGTVLPAASFGLWFYSATVEVYVIPLFFLTLSLYLLTSDRLSAKTFFVVGLINGTAIVFHQVHGLFAVTVLAAVLLGGRRGTVPVLRALSYYALAVATTAAVTYAVVMLGFLRLSFPGEAWDWFTSYAQDSQYWNPLALSTLAKAGIGVGRSVVGSHFLFAIPAVRSFVERALDDHWLADESFLVRNLDPAAAYALLGLSVVLLLAIIVVLLTSLRYLRLLLEERGGLVLLTLVWLVSYGSFFFFWEPSNVEFWIPQSVCLWLLFLALWGAPRLRAAPYRTSSVAGLLTVAALVLVLNAAGSIWFLNDRDNDYYYTKVRPLAQIAHRGDLIVVGRSWILEDYVRRYTEADVASLTDAHERHAEKTDPVGATPDARGADRPGGSPPSGEAPSGTFVEDVKEDIEATLDRGNKVLISEEAVELEPETAETLGRDAESVAALWSGYRQRWEKKDFEANTVYVLQEERP